MLTRYTPSAKVKLLQAYIGGSAESRAAILAKDLISREELELWAARYHEFGERGLRLLAPKYIREVR